MHVTKPKYYDEHLTLQNLIISKRNISEKIREIRENTTKDGRNSSAPVLCNVYYRGVRAHY